MSLSDQINRFSLYIWGKNYVQVPRQFGAPDAVLPLPETPYINLRQHTDVLGARPSSEAQRSCDDDVTLSHHPEVAEGDLQHLQLSRLQVWYRGITKIDFWCQIMLKEQ